jgi:putative mRNA 3-end processing factor
MYLFLSYHFILNRCLSWHMPLLEFNDCGIYCRQADVYLDPWKPVKRALITHGHSDHAASGHQHYLCTHAASPVISYRLQLAQQLETVDYGETVTINGVKFSFHPAGHIPGSAQIRVEYNGEVWVFSGDYKLEGDNLCEPFEPVRCHTFISESTFGLPIYKWKPQSEVFADVNAWWKKNIDDGKVSVIAGYSLGKAQRILKNVDTSLGKIFVHGAVDNVTSILRKQGLNIPSTTRVTPEMKRSDFDGALIVCPPSAVGSPWIRRFEPYSLGIASGWMNLRGARRRRGADRGFVLSDHADWNDLNVAVKETEATKVYLTHGYSEVFSRWLNENGIESDVVRTQYEGELSEMIEGKESETVAGVSTDNAV